MLQRKRSRKPTAFLYGGEEVLVFADARTSLKVIDLFNDGELYEELKAEILLRLLFPDPAGTVSGSVQASSRFSPSCFGSCAAWTLTVRTAAMQAVSASSTSSTIPSLSAHR